MGYGRHWVEYLLKISDGGINWGTMEDMYMKSSLDGTRYEIPKCEKCGVYVQPTEKLFCWECPKCGLKWGACDDRDS